ARTERELDAVHARVAVANLHVRLAEPANVDTDWDKRLEHRRVRGDEGDLDEVEQLRLRARDVLDAAEQLEMDRRDRGDDADVRARDLGERPDLPRSAHAHLGDDDVGVGLDAAERQRQPDLVVVAVLGGDDARTLPQQGGEDVLRRRLSHRAGDRHDAGIRALAYRAPDGGERAERVVGDERGSGAVRTRVLH